MNLYSACEALLEEVVHFPLSPSWFDTIAFFSKKVDILGIVYRVLRL